MKKNLFYYLFAVICSVALFTSCSDDDDEKMVNPVPQTTFTGENGLQLTYNGAPMPGKRNKRIPGTYLRQQLNTCRVLKADNLGVFAGY